MSKSCLCILAALALIGPGANLHKQPAPDKPQSHPTLRPLPEISKRPLATGPSFFVNPVQGKDDAAGHEKTPWRTINHALKQLKAGDTLYLRGGVYREQVYCAVAGKPDAPITVRAYPGERVILDGGLAEFFDAPARAWEPFPTGAPDEYRSVTSYKNIRDVVGLFGDSHIALQTYWHTMEYASIACWLAAPRLRIE